MKQIRKIHRGYKEWEDSQVPFRQIFGKWHYIYSSDKGEISLIQLPNYFMDGKTIWEIYSLEGDLFEGVERFTTKREAEVQIKKYLDSQTKQDEGDSK